MTHEEQSIHERALFLSRSHRNVEKDLTYIFSEIRRTKLFKKLNKPSVFAYAVEVLGLAESTAYALNAVSKKCQEVPELKSALEDHRLTVAKANRILSILDCENADEIIAMAEKSSWREIDREVARRNPKAANPTRVKHLSEDLVQITITMSAAAYAKHERVKSLEAQRGNTGDFQEVLYDEYLFKHDKVQKAERAKPRRYSVRTEKSRKLTAEQEHAVFKRDQGRCTHTENGKRCNLDKWIHIHHIRPVSEGGSNDVENLTTLCSFHHERVHHNMTESRRAAKSGMRT